VLTFTLLRMLSDFQSHKFVVSGNSGKIYLPPPLLVFQRVQVSHLQGMTRTRWAMMDMRCREGWRLNSTTSPSRRWRSTMSPALRP